jgi:hypothetical protein
LVLNYIKYKKEVSMNPFAKIKVKCCVCGKEEENLYKVLVKEG